MSGDEVVKVSVMVWDDSGRMLFLFIMCVVVFDLFDLC